MKTFAKFVLICGSGLIFIGLLLILLALAFGSDIHVIEQRLEQIGVVHIDKLPWDWDASFAQEQRAFEADLTDPPRPAEFEAGVYEIKNLKFDFDLGDIRIIAGDDFGLIYGNDNTRHHYSEKRSGDKWIISSNQVKWRWFWPRIFRLNDIRLTVMLPRDFVAEDMSISIGAGNMQAGSLQARTLLLDIGLGNCQIGGFGAADATIKVGAGNLEIARLNASQTKLEVGVGSMDIGLALPLTQYRCRAEVGLGNVELGGNSYSGVANVSNGPADAPFSLEINCGMGNVNVWEAGR